MSANTPKDWREARGISRNFHFHPIAAAYLLASDEVDAELVYEHADFELYQMVFPSDSELIGQRDKTMDSESVRLFADRSENSEPGAEEVERAFWAGGPSVRMVSEEEGRRLESYSPLDESYRGPGDELIGRWRRFIEKDIHRSVYLYGEENGAKAKFCEKAASEIGKRTLHLDGRELWTMDLAEWRHVLELISPNVVIVEHVDAFLTTALSSPEYRTITAFVEQCHKSRLSLLCGQERDDGCRLRFRPPVVDEFQEFQGERPETRA